MEVNSYSGISLIVAQDENRAIGFKGELPWNLPDDFAWFKHKTLGHPIIMGRKTFESLGKPLPKRLNIVVSSQPDLSLPDGVILVPDYQSALKVASEQEKDEIFVIGGGVLFSEAIKTADTLYITQIFTKVEQADAWFPVFSPDHFQLKTTIPHPADKRHAFAFEIQVWNNVKT